MPRSKKSCFYDLRLRLLQDGAHNRELINFAAERECSPAPPSLVNDRIVGYHCIAVDQEISLVKKSQIPHTRDLSTVINGYPDCVQVINAFLIY